MMWTKHTLILVLLELVAWSGAATAAVSIAMFALDPHLYPDLMEGALVFAVVSAVALTLNTVLCAVWRAKR